MAFIDMKNRLVQIKIVYYGPGRGGKTTNLEYIYGRFQDRINSKMISIKTDTDRTLFFDFLPVDMGDIRGFKIKIQLYTVPGQVKYNATRKLVLNGVDGLVFVADSNADCREKNIYSLKNMEENLTGMNRNPADIPLVMQYNKRDLSQNGIPVLDVETLENDLNSRYQAPFFPASAIKGHNVLDTLRQILISTVTVIENDLQCVGRH
ncbi:MAG: GTPase domain-containing protein [Thermodesulfobacteriota bacterium]